MTEDRNTRPPTNDDGGGGHPATPGSYFGWPEGQDSVQFLDENGKLMTGAEWKEWLKTKKTRVIGSGTKEDPYREPGTPA